MKRASITEAKNRLSALIDRVRQGESVLIEDRGIAVAQLMPVAGRDAGVDADRVGRLERQGILRPPLSSGPSKRLLAAGPKAKRGPSLSDLVISERRHGW